MAPNLPLASELTARWRSCIQHFEVGRLGTEGTLDHFDILLSLRNRAKVLFLALHALLHDKLSMAELLPTRWLLSHAGLPTACDAAMRLSQDTTMESLSRCQDSDRLKVS